MGVKMAESITLEADDIKTILQHGSLDVETESGTIYIMLNLDMKQQRDILLSL